MRKNPSVGMLGGTLYKEIKEHILFALSEGEWTPGEAIPAEKKLGERFGVSIGTLRKAIDELVAENILIRHQGRGTFVATHGHDRHLYRFFRIVRQDGVKAYPEVKLEQFRSSKAKGDVCDKLGVAEGSPVFSFINTLSLDNEIVMLDEIIVPQSLFPGLTETHMRERTSTLYDLYQDVFGWNVIATDERLRATLASAAQAKLLQVETGTPLIEIRRVAYSYHQQPLEWRISRLNTTKYEYLAQNILE